MEQPPRIGVDGQWLLPAGGAGSALLDVASRIVDAGLDVVSIGDHISFRNGLGFDGMINAMAWLASHPSLTALIGVYQIPARHPVLIAPQIASIAELAPGRLVVGVGVGARTLASCGTWVSTPRPGVAARMST